MMVFVGEVITDHAAKCAFWVRSSDPSALNKELIGVRYESLLFWHISCRRAAQTMALHVLGWYNRVCEALTSSLRMEASSASDCGQKSVRYLD